MEIYLPPNRQLSLKTMVLPLTDPIASKGAYNSWLLAQMHLAGRKVAAVKAQRSVEVLSVNELVFYEPIQSGDEVSYYAEVVHMNQTSLTLQVEAWARRAMQPEDVKVTEGCFIFIINEPKAISVNCA